MIVLTGNKMHPHAPLPNTITDNINDRHKQNNYIKSTNINLGQYKGPQLAQVQIFYRNKTKATLWHIAECLFCNYLDLDFWWVIITALDSFEICFSIIYCGSDIRALCVLDLGISFFNLPALNTVARCACMSINL